MDADALNGCRVLVTRPQPQAHELAERIRAAGGRAWECPALAIEPRLHDPRARELVGSLDRYHSVIFISANAAHYGLQLIRELWGTPPSAPQWLAVGEATARALAEAGLQPLTPEQGTDSEALLSLDRLRCVAGRRVLIMRGQGGRETLAATLRERGAEVDYAELYQRVPPAATAKHLPQLLASQPFDWVLVTSGEALQNLVTMAGSEAQTIRACPLVVLSPRLAQLAEDLGFHRIHTTDSASQDAVLRFLRDRAAARPE